MGKNLQPRCTFRTDEELIAKMSVIAAEHSRTRNKEIEYVLKTYVKEYEQNNGTIEVKQFNIKSVSHSGNGDINIG